MSNEQAKQVLQQGITAARAGQQAQARQLLQEAVKRDPTSEAAWLWLSSVAKDNQERIFCLKQLLALNPNNENAIKGLKQLGVQVTAGSPPPPPASGVPLPDEQKLSASIAQLDPILQNYQPLPMRSLPFDWTKKRRGRVGDSSAAILRIGLAGAAAAVVVVLIGLGYLFVSRFGGASGVAAIFASPTPSSTPTFTPTATPGVTDTPSPTPKSPIPTSAPPANITPGSVDNRQSTAIYPQGGGNALTDALDLANEGNYKDAIDKLGRELNGLSISKGKEYDAILFHEVRVYVDSDNADRAIALLNDNKSDSAYYQAALGYALFAKADYDNALVQLNRAFDTDRDLTLAALASAKINVLRQKYADAVRTLNFGLERHPSDVTLLDARGSANLAAGNFQEALSDAKLALYVDPLDEGAYILRCRALLALAANLQDRDARIQAFGTAVLAAKDFLLYYPSETASWLMLGSARQGEENINDAINAYAQAIVVDKTSLYAKEVFTARGKMYMDQHDFSSAFEDYNNALAAGDTTANGRPQSALDRADDANIAPLVQDQARNGRLQAALALKNYKAAADDVAVLLKANPGNTDLLFTQIDLLVRAGKFADAKSALDPAFNALNKDDKARSLLYRGIISARLGAPAKGDGLQDLNDSIALRDTSLGHYYRGQIFEAQGQLDNAATDYQWLVFWNKLYNFDYMSDVTDRLNKLPTPTPSVTPRGQRASLTPSPTRTPTLSRKTPTDTLEPTDTPTSTPTPSLTPTSGPTTSTEAATGPATEAATGPATEIATGAATQAVTEAATPDATLTAAAESTPSDSETPTASARQGGGRPVPGE